MAYYNQAGFYNQQLYYNDSVGLNLGRSAYTRLAQQALHENSLGVLAAVPDKEDEEVLLKALSEYYVNYY